MQKTQLLLHEPNKTSFGFLCDLTLSWKGAYKVPGNLGGGGGRRLYTGQAVAWDTAHTNNHRSNWIGKAWGCGKAARNCNSFLSRLNLSHCRRITSSCSMYPVPLSLKTGFYSYTNHADNISALVLKLLWPFPSFLVLLAERKDISTYAPSHSHSHTQTAPITHALVCKHHL